MESETNSRAWMWEFHLNQFRILPGIAKGSDSHRRHAYIRNIASMLTILNLVSGGLYRWGPSAIQLRISGDYNQVSEVYGAINLCVLVLVLLGIFIAVRKWVQLVYGIHTTESIRCRWRKALGPSDDSTR
jgi:hypothetical protein